MMACMKTTLITHWTPLDAISPEISSFPAVVIAYDDVPAARHAIRSLTSIFNRLGLGRDIHPDLWRFDLLEDPDNFAAALADGIKADIIVIATSSSHRLNGLVENGLRSAWRESAEATP